MRGVRGEWAGAPTRGPGCDIGYRYFGARNARAAPAAPSRASRAISPASRWRFASRLHIPVGRSRKGLRSSDPLPSLSPGLSRELFGEILSKRPRGQINQDEADASRPPRRKRSGATGRGRRRFVDHRRRPLRIGFVSYSLSIPGRRTVRLRYLPPCF